MATSLQLVVTTLDNEKQLLNLLGRTKGMFDSVTVVDSGSSDNTVRVATEAGARVVTHPYRSQSSQLNWILDTQVHCDWVVIVDSDEYPLFDVRELRDAVAQADATGKDALAVRRRNHAWGTWVRHGGWYPDYQVRVLRSSASLRYESVAVHAHVMVPRERILFSKLDLHHDTYATVDDYWAGLLRYTTLELSIPYSLRTRSARPRGGRLKVLARLMPGRVALRFLYAYIWRAGFLDGAIGWHLALWSAIYQDVLNARRRFASAA